MIKDGKIRFQKKKQKNHENQLKKQIKLNAERDEIEKNKLQEALKSKQIEIKRMRTKPKTRKK
jgi:hypothetical protein